jgi:hypothetical protein
MAAASTPLSVSGRISGIEDSIRIQVRELSSAVPLADSCCHGAASGTGQPWHATAQTRRELTRTHRRGLARQRRGGSCPVRRHRPPLPGSGIQVLRAAFHDPSGCEEVPGGRLQQGRHDGHPRDHGPGSTHGPDGHAPGSCQPRADVLPCDPSRRLPVQLPA